MALRRLHILLAGLALVSAAQAQRPVVPRGPVPPAPASSEVEKLTDAERIARLQRGIDDTQAQINGLRDGLGDPQSEYKKAETEFAELDGQLEAAKKEIQRLKSEGTANLGERETALADTEKKRTLARERFDLAIKERKAIQDQAAILEQKLQQDREALNKLLGLGDPKAPAQTEPKTAAAPTTQPAIEKQPAVQPAGEQPATPSDLTGALNPLAGAQPASPAALPSGAAKGPPSEKLVKAQETASSKQAEAEEAKQEALSLTERVESIRKVIATERDLRRTAAQKKENAQATLDALRAESGQKLASGIPYSQLGSLADQIVEAEKRVSEADAEIRQRGEVIEARQKELDDLQIEQIAALQAAKAKMEEAQAAKKELEHLKNPLAPQNIWHWVVAHGPKIGATIVVSLILLWLIQVMEMRFVRLITKHGVAGTQEDRESRARTLAGVLQNALTVIVVVGAILLIIAESGFNITALLGATAVIGLAVAFGAQNLIRDYFYGFMILMENQYLVNDVVRLGSISGQVERITLRITVLRDLRGTVHFVPHGQITTVSNLTRGWARVVLDVGVAYKEDVDRVIKVLADLGKEIRRDPAYRDLILDEPEISGVDALGDSAVVVRFLIKTRPLKQWIVKREMLRRIKNKFDELKIEIPFPHQTVYNKFERKGGDSIRLISSQPREVEVEEWPAPKTAG